MDPNCKGQGEAKITVKDGLISYQNDKYDDKLLAHPPIRTEGVANQTRL